MDQRLLYSSMLLLLWVFLFYLVEIADGSAFFGATTVMFTGANTNGFPVDITITTQVFGTVWPDYRIALMLPRFTQRLTETNATYTNLTTTQLLISPSLTFEAEWLEPDTVSNYNENQFPYPNSVLLFKTKNNATILSGSVVSVKVYKENGIGPFCGFPNSVIQNVSGNAFTPTPDFRIVLVRPVIHEYNETLYFHNYTFSNSGQFLHYSNRTYNDTLSRYVNKFFNYDTSRIIDTYSGLGNGCGNLRSCSNAGVCDYCFQKCNCFPGRGASTDIMGVGSAPAIDCSLRVCPAGRAVGSIPTSEKEAHPLAECSNAGVCNRVTGICKCYPPFSGSACEKCKSFLVTYSSSLSQVSCLLSVLVNCPNDCSGHGECRNMKDLARTYTLNSPDQFAVTYGSAQGMDTIAWDHQTMRGCVCSSKWLVGFGAGETQLGEWFGPDCSLRE